MTVLADPSSCLRVGRGKKFVILFVVLRGIMRAIADLGHRSRSNT